MSKIHVLKNIGSGMYEVVVHTPMPGGNNSAGFSWQSVWVNAGYNTTRLTTGVGPGHISALEAADVADGSVIELFFTMPAESGGATPQSLNEMVDAFVQERLANLAQTLKYYGYTQ